MAYVKDLKDQILTTDSAILYCAVCGAENSANAGDYWNCRPDYEFSCCDESMQLVIKRTIYEAQEIADNNRINSEDGDYYKFALWPCNVCKAQKPECDTDRQHFPCFED